MSPYALISLFSSILSIFLGNFIYYKNPKNKLNQLIAILCFLVGYLSFVEFGLRQSETYYTAYLWLKATFLWPIMTPLLLNIVLVVTHKNKLLKNKIFLLLLYIPSVIISLILLTTNQINGSMILEYWGWTAILTVNSPILYLSSLWIMILGVTSISLCYLYYRKSLGLEKQQTVYILTGLTVVMTLSLVTELILPLSSIKFPEMTYFSATMGLLFISYGVSQYRLPSLTPSLATDEIVSTISNFLIITNNKQEIKYMNPAGLKLLGYVDKEINGKNIKTIIPEHLKSKSLQDKCGINNFETTLRDKNGENIPILLSTSAISRKSILLGILFMGTDIRERKAVEMEKRAIIKQTITHQSVLLELYKEDISDLETTLKKLTETNSKTLDVDRVSVWFFNEDKTLIQCSDLYSLHEDHHEKGLTFEAGNCHEYLEALNKSHNIAAKNAQTNPETSEFSESYLKPNRILSRMDVPIWLQGEMVGILCHEHKINMREWTMEEQDFAASISYMISLSLEVSKREKAQKQIINSLKEKEVLLREVHHRVKNNMQIISSLLSLQSNIIENNEMKDIFKETQNRVRSMSMIHEQLYQSEDFVRIDFYNYVNGLIKSLFQTYSTGSHIELDLDVDEEVKLNIETSIPCGLIINELVINSLKHAFKDRLNGKIWVKMKKKDDEIILKLADNGTGLPEDFKLENAQTLGLELVNNLIKQIDGKIEVNTEHGTSFIITFKELEYKPRV